MPKSSLPANVTGLDLLTRHMQQANTGSEMTRTDPYAGAHVQYRGTPSEEPRSSGPYSPSRMALEDMYQMMVPQSAAEGLMAIVPAGNVLTPIKRWIAPGMMKNAEKFISRANKAGIDRMDQSEAYGAINELFQRAVRDKDTGKVVTASEVGDRQYFHDEILDYGFNIGEDPRLPGGPYDDTWQFYDRLAEHEGVLWPYEDFERIVDGYWQEAFGANKKVMW